LAEELRREEREFIMEDQKGQDGVALMVVIGVILVFVIILLLYMG
jgi:hypothetical protein